MLIEHAGIRPQIAPTAYVAPTAVVSGDVRIGAGSRVLFGAVLTADGGPVEVGVDCVIMENAVVRGRERHPTILGDHVLVGPHSHINGAIIEADVFIATGASVFPGAVIETGSEVRINAIVHVNSRVTKGSTIPIGWIAVGDPAQVFSPDRHEEYWPILKALDFPGTVFGIARNELTMSRLTSAYADMFGDHVTDTVC